MMLLFETPAGFALFKVLDEGKLSNLEGLAKEFSSPNSVQKVLMLKAFHKFENTSEALEAATKLLEGAPSESLLKFLEANVEGETLALADSKLGDKIKEELNIDCVHNNVVIELLRGVRSQFKELIPALSDEDLAPMSLDLSHSLARNKLGLNSDCDKVDTMIIQLDDLDKELNKSAMRVRKLYSRHFPELAKIIHDNILYAKCVKLMGNRINAAKLDFSEILAEEIEADLKEAAVISKGKEVNELELMNICEICDQVVSLAEKRAQLYDELKTIMNIVAPNLTALVGELVGARLISHAGGLWNLAKLPGSKIQMLKNGLIYNAPLVSQAVGKHKGQIARSLAAKAALAIRCDAFGGGKDNTMGLENLAKLEERLRTLEGKPKIEVYDKTCNTPEDSLGETPAKSMDNEEEEPEKDEELTRGNPLIFLLLRLTKFCKGSYFSRCFGL